MRMRWLMCVLLGTLAWGQAAPGAPIPPQPAQPPADNSASVPATAAVLTVTGECPAAPKATPAPKSAAGKAAATTKSPASVSGADCKTVITKAEFEKLASGISPNVTPQLKKQLAAALPQLIALSNEAKKKGLDKTPQFAETVKFAKMQILTNELKRNLQEEAGKVSPEDIEKYYKEHAESYEQFNVDRLFVPRTKQSEPEAQDDNEKNEKLSEEAQKAKQAEEKAKSDEGEQAMSKLAENLRARAAKGEAFAVLQKEAFESAGMKIEAPTVNLPAIRRTGLPPSQAAVFSLNAGEVSQVINDSGGHYIYKLNSKSAIPLEQAKNEIHSKLQGDRIREMMEKLNNSFHVVTNEEYFGPGGVAGPALPRMPGAHSNPPPTQPQPQTAPPSQPPANPN